MTEHRLYLSTFGRYLSSRTTGRHVREQIESHFQNGAAKLTVDFDGVTACSDSFTDEAFGMLVAAHGKEWFRSRLSLVNFSPEDRADILGVLRRRAAGAAESLRGTKPAHAGIPL